MEITLVRTKFTDKETRGILGCGNVFFGYTIEPPCDENTTEKDVYAVPEGEYSIEIRNNPAAGVPCIKVVGEKYSNETSIRCAKSAWSKGCYIVLLANETNTGDPHIVDVSAWSKLLAFLLENDNVKLIIK